MPLGWSKHAPLDDLPAAERRGAMLALAHVTDTARGMRRTAAGRTAVAVSRSDAAIPTMAADAIEAAVAITRRELSPPLKPWHVPPAHAAE